MNENQKNLLMILGLPVAVVGAILIMIPFMLFNAWAAQLMYGWFVLPLGAPELNLWHIWGLLLLIGLLRSRKSDDDGFLKMFGKMLGAVLGGLLVLLLGFLIKGHI